MIEGVEPFYKQIAESVKGAIPEPWQTATVDAIFFRDSNDYVGEYLIDAISRPKGFSVDLTTIRAFRGLRELFKKAGKPLWCRAGFELHSDGEFKMNWGYDDCDQDGFAHFDERREFERKRQIRMRQGASS